MNAISVQQESRANLEDVEMRRCSTDSEKSQKSRIEAKIRARIEGLGEELSHNEPAVGDGEARDGQVQRPTSSTTSWTALTAIGRLFRFS